MRNWLAGVMLLTSMMIVGNLVTEDLSFWEYTAWMFLPAALTLGAVGLIGRRE